MQVAHQWQQLQPQQHAELQPSALLAFAKRLALHYDDSLLLRFVALVRIRFELAHPLLRALALLSSAALTVESTLALFGAYFPLA